jgi:enoyl-CoA hydratase/carnithine racemase
VTDLALLERCGSIARLTLNRPEARNALSIELLDALHASMDEIERLQDAHVLVLAGAGKAFCAGMDLKAVLGDPEAPPRLLHSLADFALRLRRLPMVVIASANGAAIGGGCGLTCVCDFCVTHADARMGFPEVDLGVCPAVVAPWLVRKIGAGRARTVLLQGGLMSGQDAFDIGIVSQVVETRDALDPAVEDLANRIASGGPQALAATKSLLNELDHSLDAAVAKKGADLSAQVLATDQAQASLRAKFASS